jgi:predicted HicB family RNase H-like nuclease
MISENQDRSRFDRHIVVNCEDDMHKAVMERAAREMISASAWIRQAVRARLQTETP